MSLFTETLSLGVGMAAVCTLPFYSSRIRHHSRVIFLMGTGALFGICFFDLIPDVFELGGNRSLLIVGAVWILYSLLHTFHIGHHEHSNVQDESKGHEPLSSLFFASIITHCFASGMLLAISQGFSPKIAWTVFAALVAHKGYESLIVSSILVEQKRSWAWKAVATLIYSAALPVGVAVTARFREVMNQDVAVIISSVAVGTLMGCLVFDFLIPSFHHLKHQRKQAAWILLGLVTTQIVLGTL